MNKSYTSIQQQQQQQQQNIDDEQIEKTLNFFDAILDPYLHDDDDNDATDKKSDYHIISTNNSTTQQTKHDHDGDTLTHTHVSASAYSSSSKRPTYLQFRNIHPRYSQISSAVPTHHVRRYTSENNLNHIGTPLKPSTALQKASRPEPLQTTTASTEDLSTVPSSRTNFSSQAHLPTLADKINGASASLIDLTAIDKISRPRFRFIPPSSTNNILKEESETEQQQQQQRGNPKLDQFQPKPTPSNQLKHSHKIFKPTVIIPPKPKSAPITRLTETNIHHQNNNSAFKPPRSSKNPTSSKLQQAAASSSNLKRTDAVHKSNVHVGLTNSNNQLINNDFLFRQQQIIPNFHQSMLNLSSSGIQETRNTNMFGQRIIYQPSSSNFIRSPPYVPQLNKLHRHYQCPPPPAHFDDSVSRRIQQVNHSSKVNGLVHPSYRQPFIHGGGNRCQPQSYPYNPYISTGSGLSSPRNSYDYLHRQQPYLNPVKVHKHHTPQNPAPVQSVYLSSLPTSTHDMFSIPPSNIYHFNSSNSSGGEQSRRNPYHQNFNVTTYL
ncbi:unnamed protein product [Adineta steineri]|uniref:Uncharacterized protein n=1 Tax=Adineta steineri TaxID=433720 RepID=A0A814F850_9BILA|nr:unnamed protein product [Adineta steineri]CAF3914038.1 unnamed protein product [Adineta steineri]